VKEGCQPASQAMKNTSAKTVPYSSSLSYWGIPSRPVAWGEVKWRLFGNELKSRRAMLEW